MFWVCFAGLRLGALYETKQMEITKRTDCDCDASWRKVLFGLGSNRGTWDRQRPGHVLMDPVELRAEEK